MFAPAGAWPRGGGFLIETLLLRVDKWFFISPEGLDKPSQIRVSGPVIGLRFPTCGDSAEQALGNLAVIALT
jgi:hypothetical protein